MAQEPKKEKKKKPLGFLGFLMRCFLILLICLAITTGILYLYRKSVTVWALNSYSHSIVVALTSEQYGLSDNPEDRDAWKTQLHSKTQNLISYYSKVENNEWKDKFLGLHQNLQEIFHDRKVTVEEIEKFSAKIDECLVGFDQVGHSTEDSGEDNSSDNESTGDNAVNETSDTEN